MPASWPVHSACRSVSANPGHSNSTRKSGARFAAKGADPPANLKARRRNPPRHRARCRRGRGRRAVDIGPHRGRRRRLNDEARSFDRLRRAVEPINPCGDELAERHRQYGNAAIGRPGVADEPPALRDQRAAGLRLDMHARARDQCRNHVIVGVVLDAQVPLLASPAPPPARITGWRALFSPIDKIRASGLIGT